MILSKNTISELYKAFLLVCAIYQSTAEQVGRAVCLNLSCLLSHINAFYRATAEAKETEQIKKLHNLVHRFLFWFLIQTNKKTKAKQPITKPLNILEPQDPTVYIQA